MTCLTLEISPKTEDVVHERIFDGLSVLLAGRNIGRVIESRIQSTGNTYVIFSTDDKQSQTVIDEILDNEQIASLVTLSTGQQVPMVIRGESPQVEPINDSILGSFTHVGPEQKYAVRNCLYCRHFLMRPSGFGVDLKLICSKSMDNDAFKNPLPITQRSNESVLLLREAINIADQCDQFEEN